MRSNLVNTLCKEKANIKLPTVAGNQISSGSIILVKLSVRPLESSGRRFDVVGLGLNSVDLVAEITGPLNPNVKYPARGIYRNAGGQTATALTACAKLEWRARYIGHFGDDDNGSFSESTLVAAGVDVSACRTVPDTTNQFALIIVDQRNGDRTIVWQRDPALRMRPEDVNLKSVTSGRVLLVDCAETEAATKAARFARKAGIPTVIDVERMRPNIDSLLSEVDVIIAAQEFPSAYTGYPDLGRAVHQLYKRFKASLVVVTLGDQGSLAVIEGREVSTSGFRVKVVDTTGAGDAFRGGFISAWLASDGNGDVTELLRYANAVAALNCRGLGARGGLPTRSEVQKLLAAVS